MRIKKSRLVLSILAITVYAAMANMYAYGCWAPLTITLLSPVNTTYSVNSVPLTFTVNRDTSWIGYCVDDLGNVTIAGNTTLSGLSDGEHTVIVYSNDTCGIMSASDMVHFAVDTTPPNVTDISQEPPVNNVMPEDEVAVTATVTDNVSGVMQVTLNYTNGNGTWSKVDMVNSNGDEWNAAIPAFPLGTNVTYILSAKDAVSNSVTTEEMGYTYKYPVIPEFPAIVMLSLFMLTTPLAALLYKRRKSASSN